MFNNFFRKSLLLLDNVKKRGRYRQATDDNKIRGTKDAIDISRN
jgi:hypothetical protein